MQAFSKEVVWPESQEASLVGTEGILWTEIFALHLALYTASSSSSPLLSGLTDILMRSGGGGGGVGGVVKE